MNGTITKSEIDEDCYSDKNINGWQKMSEEMPSEYSKILLAYHEKTNIYDLYIGKYSECRGIEWGAGWTAGDGNDMHPAIIEDFSYWREIEKIKVFAELPSVKTKDKLLNEFFYINEFSLPHEDGCNCVFSAQLIIGFDISRSKIDFLKTNGYVQLHGLDSIFYSYEYTRGDFVL